MRFMVYGGPVIPPHVEGVWKPQVSRKNKCIKLGGGFNFFACSNPNPGEMIKR